MFELNLIRTTITQSEDSEKYFRYIRVANAIILIAGIFLVVRTVQTRVTIASLSRQESRLYDEIERSRALYKIDELEQEWIGYYDKLMTIDGFMKNRTAWTVRLGALSKLVPENMYITNLSVSQGNEGDYLSIDAIAASGDSQEFNLVNTFLENVAASPYFSKDVKLVSHERTMDKEKEVESVKIAVVLPPGNTNEQ